MSDDMVYVGIKRCGCCVAYCDDDPEYPQDTAEMVRDMIATGYSIERKPRAWMVANLTACPHKPTPGAAQGGGR